jgi:hypothetical protein
MLNSVKTITAAALVLGLSAAFLVAQPSDRLGGGVPGAEQEAEPAPPVFVTGKVVGYGECGGSAGNRTGSRVEDHGMTCEVKMEWNDPRLDGTNTYVDIGVEYTDSSGLEIGHYVHNIVTDDGAWRMRPQFRIDSADGPENFTGTWVLDGEGAYEGLIAVLAKSELDSVPLTGYIISGDLPPAPEGASTK